MDEEIKPPGSNPISEQIIGYLLEIQNGSAPKVYACVKEIQALLDKHTKDLEKEKKEVASILKNEMRVYYRTKHERDRLILSEKINKILMPAI